MEGPIADAFSANKKELLEKKNVVGMTISKRLVKGIKTDEDTITVFVREKVAVEALKARDLVPAKVSGIPTDVVEVGDIVAYQTPPGERKKPWRPAPPGVSIGHYKITAGTFGCVVKDQNGQRLILSNNHVLANTNDAGIGDEIRQPGPLDGGSGRFASLHKFESIYFPGDENLTAWERFVCAIINFFRWLMGKAPVDCGVQPKDNYIDAALGKPVEDSDIIDPILDLGVPQGIVEPVEDMLVRKSGRTTGTTDGRIAFVGSTVKVGYGGGKTATFEDQMMIKTGAFSSGGDSGSAIITLIDGEPYLVGLLFAGSMFFTIGNKISRVFNTLEVAL